MSAPKVLIVDDNDLNVELVSMVLTPAGMEVTSAGDAAAAMRCIESMQPDLILMDVQLPGMDGMALTRLIKAQTQTRHIPIVALTAYAMRSDEERLIEAGCDGYLAKPIDVASFAGRVLGFLRP
jgi:CheY-like chemotaxis protein